MQKVYVEKMMLRACDCDMLGVWRPGAVLTAMQETAGTHSALLDLPRDKMDRMGVAWVLSRVKVEFDRMPKMGEEITIETYPTPGRHMFFPRSHVFRDANGEKIGAANSLWVIIDIESRKIGKGEGITEKLPDNSDMEMALGMPMTVRALGGEAVKGEIAPAFTDIDVNMHVNNTKYVDWCCNALGIEEMKESWVRAFDVNYEAEVLPGAQVATEMTREGNKFAYCGFIDGKRHFAIGGVLESRN